MTQSQGALGPPQPVAAAPGNIFFLSPGQIDGDFRDCGSTGNGLKTHNCLFQDIATYCLVKTQGKGSRSVLIEHRSCRFSVAVGLRLIVTVLVPEVNIC